MDTKPIYMDYAATTPVHPDVLAAMLPYFSDCFGNASSLHSYGRDALEALEKARQDIAARIGALPEEIVFTAGGSESNNFAIKGMAFSLRDKGNHVITSAIEHLSVLEPCGFLEKHGFEVTRLPVDADGMVDPGGLEKAITDRTILVSVMHANNEIGTVQPVEEIGAVARERGVCFHTDAVQTAGKIDLDVNALNADLVSASGHKFQGPKGVGFLYVKNGTRIQPFLHGGHQEEGRRASTHNVAGIVGLAKALKLALADRESEAARLTNLRDRLIRGILENVEGSLLNGHPQKRLPNNVNVSIPRVEGEALLLALDMEGIACSSGSACSSGTGEPSHVLTAIRLSREIARGSLRFSLGRLTTDKDVDRVIAVLPGIVEKLRRISPLKGGQQNEKKL